MLAEGKQGSGALRLCRERCFGAHAASFKQLPAKPSI